jgi:hypothetical protein
VDGQVLKPALWAVFAGAVLTFGSHWLLQAIGPVERAEATTEARDNHDPGSGTRSYHLVLRTASGERFEAWGTDKRLDILPGEQVRVEISEVGHEVQGVEYYGRQVSTDGGGDLVFWSVLVGGGMLLAAVGACTEADRRVLAAAGTAAGLGVGALPVLLLF